MDAVADEFGLAWSRLEGRYDIERVVASGGFGLVYSGKHSALKNNVAVKVLRIPENTPEVQQREVSKRFLEEAQIVAALQHPSIVRVLDFGSGRMPNGKVAPWAVFEWVEGETLKDFFDRRHGAPMRPTEILALLRPVFEGLATAHALGIVHRDVKPANIMLPAEGTSALPSRILDFGIAKAMQQDEGKETGGDTRTRSKTATFSLKYAAPEQIGGVRTGPWTDVHALALIVTQALTGREVYAGKDFMEIATSVMQPQRPTPGSFGVFVGPWEAVLARAMAIKTSQRYRDAGELLAALEVALPEDKRSVSSRSAREVSAARKAETAEDLESAKTIQTGNPGALATPPTPSHDAARVQWVAIAVGVALLVLGTVAVMLHR